ncbi:MAG: hypothetical protein ACFFCX_14290 [Candidatus Sifarchaeia archaeon]
MKILHISDGGLPDPRVERMALTMRKEGHELVFLGGKEVKGQHLSVFSKTETEPLGIGVSITHNPFLKRRWLKKINEMKPDIIHAHNIVVGNFLLEMGYPAILDDHENLSAQSFVFRARPFIRRTAARTLVRKFPVWERELADRFPVLTVSEGIADYYREFTDRVGVVINVPYLSEVEWLQNPPSRKGLVYMGRDFSWPRFSPWRDMSGIRELLDFDIISGLSHKDMMIELTKHRIGLIPFRPHPFHSKCSLNKMYEYLHAGLQVVLTGRFIEGLDENTYLHPFNDFTDIVDTVCSVPEADPEKIMEFARKNYFWEKQENIVKEAYSKSLKM